MKKKVLITDNVHSSCSDILNKNSFEVNFNPGMKKEEIISSIIDYNILIVRSATKVDKDIIEAGKNLELIGRAGTGVDNIALDAATRNGILVMNTPGGNTVSAAELTVSMILSLCRNIPQADKSMKEGKWERKKFTGIELDGKTIGIIGLGKIGLEVAKRLKSFNIKIIGFDPIISKTSASRYDIELKNLDELAGMSDIITVHVPLTPDTRDMISDKFISKCKQGVKIINCARGGIVNEHAVIKAIDSGKVSGAAFDVYESEPPENTELINHPKIICTPHLGASTEDAQEKVALQIGEQIVDYYNGNGFNGIINSESIKYLNETDAKAYLDLAEVIGTLHSKLGFNEIKKIKVGITGKQIFKFSELIVSSAIKGLLSDKLELNINYINAFLLAEERGITVETEEKDIGQDYSTLVTVNIEYGSQTRSISGTVISENQKRITGIDSYKVEFNPKGNLIFYTNIDKPGVLAFVSKTLSEFGINIAGLSLGRNDKGKQAMTIITIDEAVSVEALERIRKNKEIDSLMYAEI